MVAPPPMTAERLAKVPQPYGVASVSPCVPLSSPGSSPSSSAAIWASVVWCPWPCPQVPTETVTSAEGSILTRALSPPGVMAIFLRANAWLP